MSLPPAPHPQHPQSGWQPPLTQLPVAALERRFQAFAIDRLISWGIPAAVGFLTWVAVGDEPWSIVAAAGTALVVVWFAMAVVVGVNGSSPGKAARGLRVVHHGTGTPIGAGPALLRSLVLALSGLPTFGIGVATLAWTAVEDPGGQRRGWHDHLAGSVVVDVRPAPEVEEEGQQDAPRHIVNLTAMRLVPAPAVEAPAPPTRSVEHSVRRQPPAQPTTQPPAQPPQPGPGPRPTARRAPAEPARGHRTPCSAAVAGPLRRRAELRRGGLVLVGRRPEPRAGEPSRGWSPWPRPTCRCPRPMRSSDPLLTAPSS